MLAEYLVEEMRDEEAIVWLQAAAELGDDGAQYKLGVMSYLGTRVVAQDLGAAACCLLRSANNGHARAQAMLGGMLAERIPDNPESPDTQRAVREAVRWLQEAADQNDAAGLYNIGLLYARGLGVNQDLQKAQVLLN